MGGLSSDVHGKIVSAFEQNVRDVLERHRKGGSREKLKLVRRALNLTQEEFANAYGIPYPTVRNWEQGGRGEPTGAAALLIDMIVEDPVAVSDLVAKVKARYSEKA